MSGDVLLDTSVVVAVLRRVPGLKERLRSAADLLVPLMALGELEYGANLATRDNHFNRVPGLTVLDWS